MDKLTIARVQRCGFDVYMRKPTDTWLIFTDGTHLGYLQYQPGEGTTLTTVHKPSARVGTGFQVQRNGDGFTADLLRQCFAIAPAWASADAGHVVKYRNIADYIGSDPWHAEYKQAEPML